MHTYSYLALGCVARTVGELVLWLHRGVVSFVVFEWTRGSLGSRASISHPSPFPLFTHRVSSSSSPIPDGVGDSQRDSV